MTELNDRMTRRELTKHVAENENEYVQQYVQAIFEEHDELAQEDESLTRRGFSDDGRALMRKVVAILVIASVAAGAALFGWAIGHSKPAAVTPPEASAPAPRSD